MMERWRASAALVSIAWMYAVAVPLGATRAVADPSRPMARVGPGVLRPLYPPAPGVTEVPVPPFELDRRSVTNGEFLAFVQSHPQWQRGAVSSVRADGGYLDHLAAPTDLGRDAEHEQPVTRVSWFAAKAFCTAQRKRLPTETEWELAAAAGARGPDGAAEPRFRERILSWYARPTPRALPRVGHGPPNYWGVFDLHGLVWEWVHDFNSTLVSSDSREERTGDPLRFCGASAATAGDKEDYATFMRLAFRSSLEARYTTANLGFRCARSIRDGAQ